MKNTILLILIFIFGSHLAIGHDRQGVIFKGTVVEKTIAVGSKSERRVAVLESEYGEFMLRLKGQNAFEIPVKIKNLLKKEVEISGILHNNTIIIKDMSEVFVVVAHSKAPQLGKRIVGKVVKKRLARGSKSEHENLILKTEGKEYALRILNANPFEISEDLLKLERMDVEVFGIIHGHTIIIWKYRLMPSCSGSLAP